MGCFFSCFRFKDDRRKKEKSDLKSSPIPPKSKEPLLSRDHFLSLSIYEGFPCEDTNFQAITEEEVLESELRKQARSLKYCGALLESPAEFRNASKKLSPQTLDKIDTSFNSASSIPATSIKKLLWDDESEDLGLPQNGSAGFEGQQKDGYHDNALPSITLCNSVCLGGLNHDPEPEEGLETAALDLSAAESIALVASPSRDDTEIRRRSSGHSPYPTPLKLTDEMDTPATAYPAKQGNLRMKQFRVRTQYVYPVLNAVENLSQLAEKISEESLQLRKSKILQPISVSLSSKNVEEKRSPNAKIFDKENYGSVKRQGSGTPLSIGRVISSLENPLPVDTSLSHWLRHPPSNGRSWGETGAMKDSCLLERTPVGDRPINGLASMEDEHLHISPIWRGGNGIPNTTTKYKEDQKVSWHATPFEERLDKALSDNKLFPERNLVGFEDEGAESDGDTFLGGPGHNLRVEDSYAGPERQQHEGSRPDI